jgi:NTP pyrophosphatase (non-canonical NTP hydrolase)
MRLGALQSQHLGWLDHNFPDQQPHQPLLGLAEEVGELAHCHLKAEQGIREYAGGFDNKWRDAAMDCVGDLVIFLVSYCNSVGIDLETSVDETWERVKARDWKEHPAGGLSD